MDGNFCHRTIRTIPTPSQSPNLPVLFMSARRPLGVYVFDPSVRGRTSASGVDLSALAGLNSSVDLSENQIQAIPRKAFRGITAVKNLLLVVCGRSAHVRSQAPAYVKFWEVSSEYLIQALLQRPCSDEVFPTDRIKQEFTFLCDYILKNTSVNKWPPFPCMYQDWKKGSVLFEPRAGHLEASSWVKFRVQVLGAQRVSVKGDESVDLQLSESGVWEGKAFTGKGPQLKLVASLSETPNMITTLMTFSVVKPEQ
ncbi:hypothetical protein QQF64_007677 [Cirrhinus molitorella]|uniref:Uncharacterized protein n=1 Tax=Cirrhinus molitorella TaxID=172907 RepID=A0ABR3MB96_9TELE